MKKELIIISLILIVIIIICFTGINVNIKKRRTEAQKNKQYEAYLQEEIYGTDVVTLINKAINNNEENQVTKDEKGLYISNHQNSILIDLVMITNEEKEETTTYKMEKIYNLGTKEFIRNFNTAKFKCTKIEYHEQTGKIAYIELSQQYE